VHFAHAHYEGTDEVEACFFAAPAGYFVLGYCVVACYFCDGGKEEVSAVGEPVSVVLDQY
jgi:hypothetical protein